MYWNQRGRFFLYKVFSSIDIKPASEQRAMDYSLETIQEFDRIWELSNGGENTIYFKDLKSKIKDGAKEGIKEFIRDLKNGSLDELNGVSVENIESVNENDYDMIDAGYDYDADMKRMYEARPWMRRDN